ncbi:hypothetical protein IX83_04870 [Basilea psittacipulmonis DSM 24701]|uniref:DSBA-like thioredoxin domain-containing protein n=2 Tax=Basilea TaxID=1472344 RepID=A0A077DD23_9BURK|nr:hypothetical protein IX83_04870 [Basilea psittacipulmonis DSM 24701]
MTIDIWFDYACPFCYIAEKQLAQALIQFQKPVNVQYKSFELYPHASHIVTNSTQQRIERKYQKSPEEALHMIRSIEHYARQTGILMNYEQVQNTQTFDAHRLTHFARRKRREQAMHARLMKAYFEDNLILADHRTLILLAQEVELNPHEVADMLNSDEYCQEVRNDEQEAMQLNIQSIPFFLINQKIALTGSRSSADFLKILEQVQEEE